MFVDEYTKEWLKTLNVSRLTVLTVLRARLFQPRSNETTTIHNEKNVNFIVFNS